MEIISTGEPVFVSDYEARMLLEERKQLSQSAPGVLCQDALTVEYETLTYLTNTSPVSQMKSPKVFEDLMEYLKALKLTKFERLQVANALPRSVIDFYVLVEECEERFDTQTIEQEIIPSISKIISPESSLNQDA